MVTVEGSSGAPAGFWGWGGMHGVALDLVMPSEEMKAQRSLGGGAKGDGVAR